MKKLKSLSRWWLIGSSLGLLFLLPILFMLVNSHGYYGHFLNKKAEPFILLDTDNQLHSLEKHKGLFTFLYFGYLNCDEVCHNQVGVMFNLKHQSKEPDLDFIFITMDPKRDSPEMLDSYFNQLGKNFYALYHPEQRVIQDLAQHYLAPFFTDRLSAAISARKDDYEIEHPGYLYLIDPDGVIKLIYPNQHLRYDYILQDLQKLKSERTPSRGPL